MNVNSAASGGGVVTGGAVVVAGSVADGSADALEAPVEALVGTVNFDKHPEVNTATATVTN